MRRTWGVTTYFNPARYKNKLANYQTFRAAFPLPLLTVELSRDGSFELPDDAAEIVLRVRGEDRLFQKEAMINYGVARLPDTCENVVWTDADLVWSRPTWAAEVEEALKTYRLVQPFSECLRMPREGDLRYYLVRGDLGAGSQEDQVQPGFGAHYLRVGKANALAAYVGHVGFAWAARRATLLRVPLYPWHINGGGDTVVTYGALNTTHPQWPAMYPGMIESVRAWIGDWYSVIDGKIGAVDGRVVHLWHGNMADRKYSARTQMLAKAKYDPRVDVRLDENGMVASNRADLVELCDAYFRERREE